MQTFTRGYEESEYDVLNRIAREWFMCDYSRLGYERQSQVYYYAKTNGEV